MGREEIDEAATRMVQQERSNLLEIRISPRGDVQAPTRQDVSWTQANDS